MQVFRTEHYSHAIKASKTSGPLGLLAVIVCTIAAVALMLAAIVHPGEIQHTLLHPHQSLSLLTSPQFPWRQILFTGLLSTDFVIYIEVGQHCCCFCVCCHNQLHIDACLLPQSAAYRCVSCACLSRRYGLSALPHTAKSGGSKQRLYSAFTACMQQVCWGAVLHVLTFSMVCCS